MTLQRNLLVVAIMRWRPPWSEIRALIRKMNRTNPVGRTAVRPGPLNTGGVWRLHQTGSSAPTRFDLIGSVADKRNGSRDEVSTQMLSQTRLTDVAVSTGAH